MSDVEKNEAVEDVIEENQDQEEREDQEQDQEQDQEENQEQDQQQEGASAKRKRDDENDAEQQQEEEDVPEVDASKKLKVESTPVESTPAPYSGPALVPGQELLVLEITPDKVGQIIGSKGMIIQEIQTRSGAKAYVNQDFPDGVNRQVNITGTSEQVKAAADLINLIITQGPTAIHVNSMAGGPTVTQIIECTQPQVGKIIGTQGATIKELQSKSGARIQIDQDFPPEVPRKINVTGTAAAVTLGIQVP